MHLLSYLTKSTDRVFLKIDLLKNTGKFLWRNQTREYDDFPALIEKFWNFVHKPELQFHLYMLSVHTVVPKIVYEIFDILLNIWIS